MKIRIATRGSDLALWQARWVAARLEEHGHSCELLVLETRGDRIDNVPLHQIEGKAFFTAEIENALLDGRADLAVHSHKDLPVDEGPHLTIAAVPARGPAGERVLIDPSAHDAAAPLLPLRTGARVGTSSPRRAEQLLALRPDLEVLSLRGNVPTRVARLREGRYDAIVLAAAGLDRLALDVDGLVPFDVPVALVVPAPAQGALAVQTRRDAAELRAICVAVLHHEETATTIRAERALLLEAGGGCSLPLGCFLSSADGVWRGEAFLGRDHPEPGRPSRWVRAEAEGIDVVLRSLREKLVASGNTRCGPLGEIRVALSGSGEAATSVLTARLEALGADVVHERVIDFVDLPYDDMDRVLASLRPGDAVAVTSRQAARRLAGRRVPTGVGVCAVGESTAGVLQDAGYVVSTVGSGGSRELALEMPAKPGATVVFPCGRAAMPDLEAVLRERGVTVVRCELYEAQPVADPERSADADVRVYMSPSAVAASLDFELGPVGSQALRMALGQTTAVALQQHGLEGIVSEGRDVESAVRLLARVSKATEVLR